jgi:hypothetical protein
LGVIYPGTRDPISGAVNRLGGYNIVGVGFDSKSDSSTTKKRFFIDQFSISNTPLPLVQTSSSAIGSSGTVIQQVRVNKMVLSPTKIAFSFTLISNDCGALFDQLQLALGNSNLTNGTTFGLSDSVFGGQSFEVNVVSSRLVEGSQKLQGWYMLSFLNYPALNISVSGKERKRGVILLLTRKSQRFLLTFLH